MSNINERNLDNLPLVSIITVCYNCKSVIEDTLKSIINQSYKNFEYIVIDGGSSDGTMEILKKYASSINVLISEKDKGIYDAMNKGIKRSRGKWLNFMNAGDTFENLNILQEVFNVNYLSNIKVIYGNAVLNFGELGLVHRDYTPLNKEEEYLNICHQSSFIDGDFLRNNPYDTNFRIAADINGFHQIYKLGYQFRHIDLYISKFDAVTGISSNKLDLCYKEILRIKGVNLFSFAGIRGLVRIYLKQLLFCLLSENRYRKMQYKKLIKKYEE